MRTAMIRQNSAVFIAAILCVGCDKNFDVLCTQYFDTNGGKAARVSTAPNEFFTKPNLRVEVADISVEMKDAGVWISGGGSSTSWPLTIRNDAAFPVRIEGKLARIMPGRALFSGPNRRRSFPAVSLSPTSEEDIGYGPGTPMATEITVNPGTTHNVTLFFDRGIESGYLEFEISGMNSSFKHNYLFSFERAMWGH